MNQTVSLRRQAKVEARARLLERMPQCLLAMLIYLLPLMALSVITSPGENDSEYRILALTALSALVVPSLYEPATLLKFAFIISGGLWGIYGVTLLFAAVLLDIFSINLYGIPTGAPVSPTGLYFWRDVFFRTSWRTLSRENLRIQDVPGSELGDRKV